MDKNYESRLHAIDQIVELLQVANVRIEVNDLVHQGTVDDEVNFFRKAKEIVYESTDYQERVANIDEDVLFNDYYLSAVDKYIKITTTPNYKQILDAQKQVLNDIRDFVVKNEIELKADGLGSYEFDFITPTNEKDFKVHLRDLIASSEYFQLAKETQPEHDVFQHLYKMAKLQLFDYKKSIGSPTVASDTSLLTHDQLKLIGIDRDHKKIFIETNGKPSRDIIGLLKSAGFRWAPNEARWQISMNDNSINKVQTQVLEPLGFNNNLAMIGIKSPVMTAEQHIEVVNDITTDLQESLKKINTQRSIYESENDKLIELMKNINWSGIEKEIESQQTVVSQELRRLMNLTSEHANKFTSVDVTQITSATKILSEQLTASESTLAEKLNQNVKEIDIKDVFDELKQGVINAFENPTEFKTLLDFSTTADNYSINNLILLQSQIDQDIIMEGNPIVTNTFNGWKQQGIHVNKGEKALKIIKPGTYKAFKDANGVIKAVNNATEQEKNLIDSGKLESFEKNYFRLKAEVFLYTQTDADISKLFADRIVEHPEATKLYEQIKEQAQANGIQVLERNIGLPSGKAVEHGNSKLIIVNDQLNDAHKLKTLIHEIAHIETHFDNNDASINTKELEAEASAYLTCKELGIDTSDYSFNYLASWSKEKEVKELTNAFNSIKKITLNIKEKYIIKSDAINNAHSMKEHDTGFKQNSKLSNNIGIDVEM